MASIVATIVFHAGSAQLFTLSRSGCPACFAATAFLFFWALFGTLQLMKLVLAVAVTNMSLFTLSDSPSRHDLTGTND